jgi:hypothetical protein
MSGRTNPGELLEEYGDIVLPAAAILASERLNVRLFNFIDQRFLAGQNEWLRSAVHVLGPSAISLVTISMTDGDIARSIAVGGGIASLENAFSQVSALPDPLDFGGHQQSGSSGIGAAEATRTGSGVLTRASKKSSLEAGNADSGLLGAGHGLGAASVSERTLDTDTNFV